MQNRCIISSKYIKAKEEYEKDRIKLSISKKMQEEYQVKSINFSIGNKLKKLIDMERIKMIKIRKTREGKI